MLSEKLNIIEEKLMRTVTIQSVAADGAETIIKVPARLVYDLILKEGRWYPGLVLEPFTLLPGGDRQDRMLAEVIAYAYNEADIRDSLDRTDELNGEVGLLMQDDDEPVNSRIVNWVVALPEVTI